MEEYEDQALRNELYGVKLRKRDIFAFVEAHSKEFRVEKMCEVLGVSRSGFYKWRSLNELK